MVKDVMVRLDGTAADEVRLAAVNGIADIFDCHIIGLYFNVMPVVVAAEDGVGAIGAAELLQAAKDAGDKVEARLIQRLTRLQKPMEIRRFDAVDNDIADVTYREARAADTFVALRPNGAPPERQDVVEAVLFDSGRHVFLVPNRKPAKAAFDRILVAWNGGRESARALAEALPYLHKANEVTVLVVDDEPSTELQTALGTDAVNHLKHHGINVALHRARIRDGGVGATLIAEARRLNADLIAMGGYGHSRLREWLLGGTTDELLHNAPIPLLVAHQRGLAGWTTFASIRRSSSKTRRSRGDLLASPRHAPSLATPCGSVGRRHGGRCMTGFARCVTRMKLSRQSAPCASCSSWRICLYTPTCRWSRNAIPDIDLCNRFSRLIIRGERLSKRRAAAPHVRSQRKCDPAFSLSPPLQPFSAQLSISTWSSSRPGSSSTPDQWFGMGSKQSPRLYLACYARAGLGNSGIRGLRSYRRCALDHRWDGDPRKLALYLLRDSSCEHLVVRDPSKTLRRSRADARLGSARMGAHCDRARSVLRIRLGLGLARLT